MKYLKHFFAINLFIGVCVSLGLVTILYLFVIFLTAIFTGLEKITCKIQVKLNSYAESFKYI